MRVLLGRPQDAQHAHRTACEDCERVVYLGERQAALARRGEPDVVIRCQQCDSALGDLRVLRVPAPKA